MQGLKSNKFERLGVIHFPTLNFECYRHTNLRDMKQPQTLLKTWH